VLDDGVEIAKHVNFRPLNARMFKLSCQEIDEFLDFARKFIFFLIINHFFSFSRFGKCMLVADWHTERTLLQE